MCSFPVTLCTSMLRVENFINGNFVATENYGDSYEPATGRKWAEIPLSTADDVERAVQAAKDAFSRWSSTTVNKRSELVMRVAQLLEDKLDEFAKIESKDQGKPFFISRTVDIPRAVQNLRHFASAYPHVLNNSNVQKEFSALNYTIRSSVGVAGLISPWNLPLYLLTFKMAPALMAGNTVVCKPSELTSVTAWKLCYLFLEAGFPAGVVNMVFGLGTDAGEALVLHPDVPLISFTGSTLTGQRIYSKAAANFKKLSLELGGKNAAIVFADADLEKCIANTVRSSFTNQGEICLATSRIFVEKDVYEKFLTNFIAETRKLKVGPYLDDGVIVGAVISEQHLIKIKNYIDVAVRDGGIIECGEGRDSLQLPQENKKGYFLLPTVITGVDDRSRCMQEEIFGPVTFITPFENEEEVIQRANDVKYGLCATVWTSNSSRLHRVAQSLQVGTVWCNCWLIRSLDMPFGGMKQSGLGREGTHESLDFFTELKTVCVQI